MANKFDIQDKINSISGTKYYSSKDMVDSVTKIQEILLDMVNWIEGKKENAKTKKRYSGSSPSIVSK